MNKRKKRKIHKRIIKKLISGQPLSNFDRKYHEDMKRKVYERIAIRENKINLNTQAQLMSSSRVVEAQTQSAANALSNFGREAKLKVDTTEIKEPSKLERVKSKVKGWFAK